MLGWLLRPKEKYASFPVTCPKILGSVGRQTFLFIKTFLYVKSMNLLRNSLKIDLFPKSLQKSLSRPQKIRVGRVTGNKTFSFFGLSDRRVVEFKTWG